MFRTSTIEQARTRLLDETVKYLTKKKLITIFTDEDNNEAFYLNMVFKKTGEVIPVAYHQSIRNALQEDLFEFSIALHKIYEMETYSFLPLLYRQKLKVLKKHCLPLRSILERKPFLNRSMVDILVTGADGDVPLNKINKLHIKINDTLVLAADPKQKYVLRDIDSRPESRLIHLKDISNMSSYLFFNKHVYRRIINSTKLAHFQQNTKTGDWQPVMFYDLEELVFARKYIIEQLRKRNQSKVKT